MGSGKINLPFQAGSNRSSQVAGFFAPAISLPKRSVLKMKPKMPTYQPVHRPVGSLKLASTLAAFGDLYASVKPCLPSGSWNSLEPPTKMSDFAEFFSVGI